MAWTGAVSMHIAILEDEAEWAERIARAVRGADCTYEWFNEPERLLQQFANGGFDVLVADVQLDDSSLLGTQVIDRLRAAGMRQPVLVLTQFAAQHRAAATLNGGADDYLAKPFDAAELCARLRALDRRAKLGDPNLITLGPLHVSRHYRTAHWNGQRIEMSDQSFNILFALASRQGEVVSQAELWNLVWNKWTSLPPQQAPIQTAISRLRKDFAAVTSSAVVQTVAGIGYRLHAC